jgi:L-2-hydroxyglutarate oxidase
MSHPFDFGILGAGILGLATARALLARRPDSRLVILEKENAVARHQTGHNSGVVHQGIYYKPGTLKAELCVRGARQMAEFCAQHALPFQRIGKVIVATAPDELPRLDMLYERAVANGVPGVARVERARLAEIEPHAAGLAALYSPNTAIVDYVRVAETLRDEIQARGALVQLNARVTKIQTRADVHIVTTPHAEFQARRLINCAGLYADEIARLAGASPEVRILPFRGEYYFVKPERSELVRGLIYPVTDPRLPFLGVHFTRTIHGAVEAGPNAVFALAREGYGWSRVNARETMENILFAGFPRMARRWWRTGIFEFYRSLSKRAFVHSLQKLVPEIRAQDLARGGAGVRAQAVNTRGELLDDFCFVEMPRALHVLNAPSPAATASLALGESIAQRAETL